MPRKTSKDTPKRAKSAFLLFCQEKRVGIKEKDPKTKFEDYGRILGQMWKNIPEDQRKKYDEKANENKQRYEEEKQDFIAKGGKVEDLGSKRKATAKKTKKDPKGVKKPLTAYIFFCKEIRPKLQNEQPKAKFGDIGRLIGLKWKELDDDSKMHFQRLADEDKQRFLKEKLTVPPCDSNQEDSEKEDEDDDEDEDEEEDEIEAPPKTQPPVKAQLKAPSKSQAKAPVKSSTEKSEKKGKAPSKSQVKVPVKSEKGKAPEPVQLKEDEEDESSEEFEDEE